MEVTLLWADTQTNEVKSNDDNNIVYLSPETSKN
jgi:hypothetical protein